MGKNIILLTPQKRMGAFSTFVHLHCSKYLKQIIPETKLHGLVLPISTLMYLGAIYIYPQLILFGTHSLAKLKRKEKKVGVLVIYVNYRQNHRSGWTGRELTLTPVWRQFPALLSATAVEPIVLTRNTAK